MGLFSRVSIVRKTSSSASASVATNERPPESWASRSSKGRFGPSTSAGRGKLRIDAPDDPADSTDRDRVQRHTKLAASRAACSGSSGRGTAGSLLPSVKSTRTFFLGGAISRVLIPQAIASPMLVPSSPAGPSARRRRSRAGRRGRGSGGTPAREGWRTRPGRSGRRFAPRRSE